MFRELLRRLFGGKPSTTEPLPNTIVDLVKESLVSGKCPDCGGEESYDGPAGGMCQNICCSNDECRSAFNVSLPFIADRISNQYWHPLRRQALRVPRG